MTRSVCVRCGLDLDPDAPETGCVCLGEQPSPSGRALSNLGRIALIATAIARDEGRKLVGGDLRLAASITSSKVEA